MSTSGPEAIVVSSAPARDTRSQPVPAVVDFQRVAAVVRRLRDVPLSLRRFSVDEQTAARSHRIEGPLLDQLLAAGMPVVGRGAERRFDEYDLGNAALHLGLLSIQRRAIRSWAAAVRAAANTTVCEFQVEVIATCPAPSHVGPCHYDLLQDNGVRRRVTRQKPEAAELQRLSLRTSAPAPALPSALRELLRELDPVEFFLLPEAIRWSHEFLFRTRMGDCGVSADWLVGEGRNRGLRTRFGFGLLLAAPYSTPHCWAEFHIGGEWLAFDPLLIRAMHTWGGLDPVVFPVDAPLNGVVHRMSSRFTKIASHGGVWAPISLRTRRPAR